VCVCVRVCVSQESSGVEALYSRALEAAVSAAPDAAVEALYSTSTCIH
jgi:hypothetical protein